MTSIKLTVIGAQAQASVTGPLTSGMVGVPITIEYDEAWDGLTKNLMCRCSPWGSNDGENRAILNVGETAAVAHEVMQADMYLYLGVEGFNDDGTLVMPTTWAYCGKIAYGANTSEDPSTDPSLSVWNQLQIEMEQTKEYVLTPEQAVNIQAYAQEARQAAEEAKQTAENGLYYTPVVTQPTDSTLKFEFQPSVIGAPSPDPVTVELPSGEDSGQDVDLTGYATEQYVQEYAQPKGDYLTEHQSLEGYAKTEDIPTKVSQLTNDSGYLTQHQDISGKADKTGLTLGIHTDGLVYLFVDGQPVGAGIELTTADVCGYVDENNNIIVSGNLADGTYSVKYELEDGSTVDIGDLVLDSNVYYSVTNTLTNCTNSNSATQAVEGGSYSATISAHSGYELSSIKVTMGGADISTSAVSGGTIAIANVTGDITITAVAEETVVTPTYTNFADPTSADWKEGYRLTNTIDEVTALTGGIVTNYVSVQQGDTLEVTGINIADSNSRQAFWFNSSNNTILRAAALTTSASLSDVSYDANSLICTVAASCDSDAKMRFSGLATGTSEDVVIKIKRNGEYL